jgi:hypothetical protein
MNQLVGKGGRQRRARLGQPSHGLVEERSSLSLAQVTLRALRNNGASNIQHHSHCEVSPKTR